MIKVQIQFFFFLNRSTALPIRSTDASVLPITFLPVWGLLFAVVAAVFVLLEVLEFLLDVSNVEGTEEDESAVLSLTEVSSADEDVSALTAFSDEISEADSDYPSVSGASTSAELGSSITGDAASITWI